MLKFKNMLLSSIGVILIGLICSGGRNVKAIGPMELNYVPMLDPVFHAMTDEQLDEWLKKQIDQFEQMKTNLEKLRKLINERNKSAWTLFAFNFPMCADCVDYFISQNSDLPNNCCLYGNYVEQCKAFVKEIKERRRFCRYGADVRITAEAPKVPHEEVRATGQKSRINRKAASSRVNKKSGAKKKSCVVSRQCTPSDSTEIIYDDTTSDKL